MDKLIIKEYPFKSPNGVYLVKKYDDGSFSCNCQEWTFKRKENRGCRHTKYIQDMVAMQNTQMYSPTESNKIITINKPLKINQPQKSASQSVVRPAERYFSLEED